MEKNKLYELTNPQKSIWLTEQMYTNTNINNISGLVILKNNVDLNILKNALYFYVKNTPALRIRIVVEHDLPKQYISDFNIFDIEVLESSFENLENLSINLSKYVFDLHENNLFLFKLIKLPNNNVAIFTNVHHLVGDAWSLSIYASKIIEIYSSMKNNENIDNLESFSYIDYYYTELAYFDSNRYNKDFLYWDELMNSSPTKTYIKNNLPKISDTSAKRKKYQLSSDLLNKINIFCTNNSCSLYTFFTSILSVYLSNINESSNISIGTTVLNRSTSKEKSTFGMYVNTLPFCIDIDSNLKFTDYISHIVSLQKAFFRHQKFPYSEIQNMLKAQHDISENIFDVALSYQNARTAFCDDNVDYETTWNFNGHTVNSLDIHFYDMNNTGILNVFYDYQVSKLTEAEVEDIHNRLSYIIEQILSSNDIIIKDVSIITPKELDFITNIFNNVSTNYPKEIPVHDLIDLAATNSPDSIAIVQDNRKVTYSDLKYNSDLIAKDLIVHGVKPNDCVSILLKDKSIELIYSMIGILKCGASFLALYPEYPEDRISYILENSRTKILITEKIYSSKYNINTLFLDNLNNLHGLHINFPKIDPNDNSYIIYTSGSTGKPKGIQISHKNLINFVYSFNYYLDNTINNSDKFLSVTNISFDVSISEIFTPLIFGATLYLYKDLTISTEMELAKYIIDNSITFSYFPPSLLNTILTELKKYNSIPLNKLLVGVEPIKTNILHEYLHLNPSLKIINGYGPSETTICCTMYKFTNSTPFNIITPIGTPICNSKIHLYNSNNKLVPINEIGEIYVEGDCVGNGYLNNPTLNDDAFNFENKIFKTGDLAKLCSDGNVYFVGRNDNQVKFRGYRIDLSEIENVIKTYPQISNSLIIHHADSDDTTNLIAYLIVDSSSTTEISFDENELRSYLISKLPHYMIPSIFIKIEAFPLTPNGKIDKKLLINTFKSNKKSINFIAPSTDSEIALAQIWSEILNKNPIGIEDNFFELGGDSLSAIKISLIASNKGIKLTSQSFYKYPTIKLLLENLEIYSTSEAKLLNKVPLLKDKKSTLSDNILLIGATGFLGIHLLHDLLLTTSSKIYCVVRGKDDHHSVSRLTEKLSYYFGDKLNEFINTRIIILNGDFTLLNLGIEDSLFNSIISNIGTIINTAAIVKHVGDNSHFHKVNVTSVETLIQICEKYPHIQLSHISTTSVAGTPSSTQTSLNFSEEDLFIGQEIDTNIYIKTKFQAEQLLAKSISNGLNISIFRVGNLTWRSTDGKFQDNQTENLFFNIINFIITAKFLPESVKYNKVNLSPVNICSNMIISILKNNNILNVYHIFNFNELTFEELICELNKINYNIEFCTDESFTEIFTKHSQINDSFLSLSEYFQFNQNSSINIISDNTISVINSLLLNWPDITADYFKIKLGGLKNNE